MKRLLAALTLLIVAAVTTAALVRPGIPGWTPRYDPTITLWYDLAGRKSLDSIRGPGITFTRASTATVFGPDGLMATAAINQPRFDHNPADGKSLGLLIEGSRQNVALQSAALGTTWTNPGGNTTISDNAAVAPDGTTTAEDVKHDDDAETIQQTITATDNTVYAISAFVKQGTTGSHDFVKIAWLDESGGNNGFEAWFDISDCSTGTAQANGTGSYTANSATARDVGGGWCRVSASGQIVSGQTDARFELINTTADAVETAEATNSVFWWGLQAAKGKYITSYIPTAAAAVTRAADVSITTGVTEFDETVGTLIVKINLRAGISANSGFDRVIEFSDSGLANVVELLLNGGNSEIYSDILSSSVGQLSSVEQGHTFASGEGIYALAYAVNDAISAFNGTLGTADTVVTLPVAAIDRFALGSTIFAGGHSGVHLAEVIYYNVRKSKAFLADITTAANDNAPVMFAANDNVEFMEAVGW